MSDTTERMQDILSELATIEKYQGDAYQIFDDVGRALYEIKCTARLVMFTQDHK